MDLSELQGARADHASDVCSDRDGVTDGYSLLGQVGSEIAGPLTTALERVCQLAATGRIDRTALRALQTEVEAARRAAILGQQLARYASGRVRPRAERVDLAQVVRDGVAQRSHEAHTRGLQLRLLLKPAEVIVDPNLLYSLVDAMLDWAIPLARSPIDVRLEHDSWPAHAHLCCRFVHCPPDEVFASDVQAQASLDSLPSRAVEQIARVMGVVVRRRDDGSQAWLSVEFPRTVNAQIEGMSAIELDPGTAASDPATGASSRFRPLAGTHVLVLSPRRDLRARVRDAIDHMGLIVDFAGSIDEAREFCREGLPHAIVHAGALCGEQLDALRAELLRDAPDFVFIGIEDGLTREALGFAEAGTTKLRLDGFESALPAALVYQLAKHL